MTQGKAIDKRKLLKEMDIYYNLILKGTGLVGSRLDLQRHWIERIKRGDFDVRR